MEIVAFYLFLINIIAFLMMGADKFNAQTEKWRIPERTLFAVVLLSGRDWRLPWNAEVPPQNKEVDISYRIPDYYRH